MNSPSRGVLSVRISCFFAVLTKRDGPSDADREHLSVVVICRLRLPERTGQALEKPEVVFREWITKGLGLRVDLGHAD